MTATLLSRLDRFVIALLDEAERQDCSETAEGDTSKTSEEGPGKPRPSASLTERIAVLKICTAYLSVRAGKALPAEPEPEEPPEIDRFVTQLRPKPGRATGGRTTR